MSQPISPVPLSLSDHDRKLLLRLVRETLERHLEAEQLPDVGSVPPHLETPAATFVTLRVKGTGELRGCRGEIVARRPLVDSVRHTAIASAIDDPRFPRVTPEEVAGLQIEISVLTPLQPIGVDEIQVGRDGVMIVKEDRSGLFLPEVPTMYGWGLEEYLNKLCWKAGLPEGSWRDADAKLFGFQTIVWGEK